MNDPDKLAKSTRRIVILTHYYCDSHSRFRGEFCCGASTFGTLGTRGRPQRGKLKITLTYGLDLTRIAVPAIVTPSASVQPEHSIR
jgi:hypothetical protein